MKAFVTSVLRAGLLIGTVLSSLPATAEQLYAGTRLCPLDTHKALFNMSMDMRPEAKPGTPAAEHNALITEAFAVLEKSDCLFLKENAQVKLTGKTAQAHEELYEIEFEGKTYWVGALMLGL